MKAGALRDMGAAELRKKLDEAERELFALRIKVSQQRNTSRIRNLRRDVARIKTILGDQGASE
jgi:large subunit ribosomal protein L29